MPNLRIVSDNAVDRASSLVASSVAGQLVASNLQTNKKSQVWRATGTSASLRAVFAVASLVSFVGLPFCNLSPTATMRVRATNEAAGTNLLTIETGKNEFWGSSAPAVRYVQAPDGTYTAVVPKPDISTQRWQINIPIAAYPNGTQLIISWHQKTVTPVATGGQVMSLTGHVGMTVGAVNSISLENGWTRKWVVITITDNSAIQIARFYVPTIGADDLAAWGWQMELGSAGPSSYYPALATFTSRASSGTYLDATGIITSATANVARMQYQYPSLATAPPRLLIEAAATNMLLYSSLQSNAVYTKGATSIGAASTAPDGSTSALGVIATAVNSQHYLLQAIALTTGTTYTFSAYVRSNGRTRLQLSNGSLGAFVKFNLATGAVHSAGGAGYNNSTIDLLPFGWFRISLTFTTTATSLQSMVLYLEDNVTASTTSVGTGAVELYTWGWMLEVGTVPTSYLATGAATTSRSADVVSYSAGVRPLGYMDWWQSYDYDSGTVLCCPAEAVQIRGWTAAQAASAYSYGGGAYADVYVPPTNALAISVDIADAANLQGYVEAARLVVGSYWSPTYNASLGASVSQVDSSRHYRSDAGELLTDAGSRYRSMQLDLNNMPASDRKAFMSILRGAGKANPVHINLFPESPDLELERDHTLYGKLSDLSAMKITQYNAYSSSLEIEEV
jgi:hypothetical protein